MQSALAFTRHDMQRAATRTAWSRGRWNLGVIAVATWQFIVRTKVIKVREEVDSWHSRCVREMSQFCNCEAQANCAAAYAAGLTTRYRSAVSRTCTQMRC
jgi:hypothetical protein